MSQNYQQLQEMVSNRLKNVDPATTAEVPNLINKAIRKLERRHNFDVMEAWAPLQTTIGVRTLGTMPTDFKQFRETADPLYVDYLGNPVRLILKKNWNPVLDHYSWNDATEVGDPHVLWAFPIDTGGGNAEEQGPTYRIDVWPYPDGQSNYTAGTQVPMPVAGTINLLANGEYPIIVPYWKYLPDLSQATDENFFTDVAEDYIVFQATAEGFYLDWDEQRAKLWEGRASDEARQIIATDKRRKMGQTSTLAVRGDVYGVRGVFRNPFTQVPGE